MCVKAGCIPALADIFNDRGKLYGTERNED